MQKVLRTLSQLSLFLLVLSILSLCFSNFHQEIRTVGANPPSEWLDGWEFRKSHVINSASGAGTNYQIGIRAHYGSGMDSGEDVYLNGKCRNDFGDVRFTSYVPFVEYYRVTVPSSIHSAYGLGYPVTYVFSIPSGSSDLKAEERTGTDWQQLIEKTSNDFFNGIECVRFDYINNKAYVSVAFAEDSDLIDIRITNQAGEVVMTQYQGMAQYYDNRKAVVVASADDWDAPKHDNFMNCCDAFQSRSVWLSVGIVTNNNRENNEGPPDWNGIQQKIDGGYVEAASHSRTHADVPYSDYDSEINGSRNDIIGNLSLPLPYKKGETEYVWAWIEPYGQSNAIIRQKLGECKYLIDRSTEQGVISFAPWDSDNGLYDRVGMAIAADGKSVGTLNAEFDLTYDNGGIYHFYFHPASYDWEGNEITQHLDYIEGKKDVWYVGFGALYAYHYVQEREQVTITPLYMSEGTEELLDYWIEEKVNGDYAVIWVKVANDLSENPATIYVYYGNPDAITTSNGVNTFLFFDDFDDNSLDMTRWDELGTGTVTESNQELTVAAGNSKQKAARQKTSNIQLGTGIEVFGRYYRYSLSEVWWTVGKVGTERNSGPWQISFGGFDTAIRVGYETTRFYVQKLVNGGGGITITYFSRTAPSSYVRARHQVFASTERFYEADSLLGEWTHELFSSSDYVKVGLSDDYGTQKRAEIAVRKLVSPEPSHGSWGNEETRVPNVAPIISEFQAPSIVYANKYFYLNATINDQNGVTEFANATVELSNSVILKWINDTNTFSVQTDPNGYCTLDPSGSLGTTINSTARKLSWRIKLNWEYPEGSKSILSSNTKVFDKQGASNSSSHTNLFYFEDDLIVYSASVDDSRINPLQTITFNGTLCYEGTQDPPEGISGITAKVNLTDTLKGSTNIIDPNGKFSVSLTGELDVAQYSYIVYAVTDENTVSDQTVNVIVDKIQVQSYTVTDDRVKINHDVNIDVLLHYDYDDTYVTDGSVTINGISATHQAGGVWRITQSKSTVQAITYNTVAVSRNTHGITEVDQAEKSITVIWDRVKVIAYSASDTRINVGENVNIDVIIRYEYDNTDVVDGNVTINNIPATYQGNGTWRITQSQLTVQALSYDTIACSGNTYGITVVNQNNQSTTVIWDRVKVTNLTASNGRIDVGSPATLTVQLVYEYDNTAVSSGSFTLNGLTLMFENEVWVITETKNSVSASTYDLVNGVDGAYGLTLINMNGQSTTVIWDRVLTTLSISDNRINVGDTAVFTVEGSYEYDSTPWVGSHTLNDTATKSTVGKYKYKIASITDSSYGLTAFQQTTPDIYVIFDRITVVVYGTDDARRDVNTEATFYLTLEYEYDSSSVVDGIGYLNGSLPLTWSSANSRWEYKTTNPSVQKLTVHLASVDGNTHGITALNPSASDKTISVIWDRIRITDGGTTRETLTLGETATIWFKAKYEFDETTFTSANGTLYLNGNQMTWSTTNTRWEHTYTANTIGTATFMISTVFDSSQGLTTINDTVGAKTITVWSMPFSIISNSVITELVFNSTSKAITFTVNGTTGTTGYTNVTIAKTLIENATDIKIYLDGNEIERTVTSTEYTWLIHFTYTHSTHKVIIQLCSLNINPPPGFSLKATAVAVIGTITALAATIFLARKKVHGKTPNQQIA